MLLTLRKSFALSVVLLASPAVAQTPQLPTVTPIQAYFRIGTMINSVCEVLNVLQQQVEIDARQTVILQRQIDELKAKCGDRCQQDK
jgi:hypothetical protein